MKKSMFLLFALISIFCKAQMSLAPRVGLNDKMNFVAGMELAYEFKHFQAAGYVLSIFPLNTSPALFGGRIGLVIGTEESPVKVTPIMGRAFRLQSMDKTEYTAGKNGWVYDLGVRVEKHFDWLDGKNTAFIQFDYFDHAMITAGIKF